jgi:hypothetical protein
MRWWPLVLASACYSPSTYQHCAISCETSGLCPGDFECRPAQNLQMVCHAPNGAQCAGLVDPPMQDSSMMTPDARDCFGHNAAPYLETCISTQAPGLQVPTTFTVAGAMDFNTNMDCHYTLAQSGGPDICVRVAEDITIKEGARLRPHGGRALLLLARHDIVIEMTGEIDVGGANGQVPPGSVMCAGARGMLGTMGGGGGGGGSFATSGREGGTGEAGVSNQGGGDPSPIIPNIFVLRGGCAGGLGGSDPAPAAAKAGGAIYLLAGHDIIVAGQIDASGDGGSGGAMFGGGGGGGSGGMIMLEAANAITIHPSAAIHALGGGGGGGGSATSPGGSGSAAKSPVILGGGGMGGGGTPPGGNGGAAGTAGDPALNGGGGGGGGDGAIRMFAPMITGSLPATVAPPRS